MPTYNPKIIEPRWQRFWEEHKVFRTPDVSDKPKFYILDMFPYPSGSGLHVGHPEGYTATDILARYRRMRGYNVLHPMGWDAFGLPAEEHARSTGEHPRIQTQTNINEFRRQIKMLGFSYDWDREVDTTDPGYYKWTQWIFLELYDTWYDADQRRGRRLAELPIPDAVKAGGTRAMRQYQDSKRLAYQIEAPVNWCPELGTVLANEEVVDGKSERGGHPVVRMPLRQWMLRITAYAERLLADLEKVDWSEAIKEMQRNWIGKSEGAEVEFALRPDRSMRDIKLGPDLQPVASQKPIHVFTTRPDTLFGATYMVLAPEHPLVDSIVAPAQRTLVEQYQMQAARKSDLERTELAKTKTGVFTGAYAINPVNSEEIPIWIADYVLASYGTGAIMAVPAHDERDFEFAREYRLPIRPVVLPPADWLTKTEVFAIVRTLAGAADSKRTSAASGTPDEQATLTNFELQVAAKATRLWDRCGRDPLKVTEQLYRQFADMFPTCFSGEGTAIASGRYDGLSTGEFKQKITAWLEQSNKGQRRVNYKLRDWLFSRQRYWGEPFPILHELDDEGRPTGLTEPVRDLPLLLPEMADFKPTGNPEPPLSKATNWVNVTINGKKYRRETNTMPQWAGSCWYYLRYLDPRNDQAFCDPGKAKYWLAVDLYVGGAEHAVLHLLYARFWHKVLYDRGHVPGPEPFQKLVNQGMILGEMEYRGIIHNDQWETIDNAPAGIRDAIESGTLVKASEIATATYTGKGRFVIDDPEDRWAVVVLSEDQIDKVGGHYVLKANPSIRVDARTFKMSKARGNVINPDDVVKEYGADSLRLYEMFMGPLEATKPWNMRGVEGVFRFLNRVWRLFIDDRADDMKLLDTVKNVEADRETQRLLHQTIQRVADDLESMSFNTAIAAMMEFSNHLTRQAIRPRSVLRTFVLLLSPFAPHLVEELWHALGEKGTLAYEPWPTYDPSLLKADMIEVPVQINGKLKAKLQVPAEIDAKALEQAALADEKIKGLLEGKTIRKIIVVPGKLVNIVVG